MTLAKKEWRRTEGDQWDVVTSVGYTALAVAAVRAVITALPNPLARDNFAESFVRASGEPYLISLLRQSSTSDAAHPGWPEYLSIQMHFFDSFFGEACVRGLRQVVIMASGLDARAYRLAWPAATRIFEVDQPKVLDFKTRVLAERGALPGTERHEVRVDLRDDWVAALIASGFDSAVPTAWLVEGLLMYLPGAAHDALLQRIHELSAPGSELGTHVYWPAENFIGVFETLGRQFDPFAQINLTDLFYDDPRVNPAEWFATQGWHVSAVATGELSTRYGRSLGGLSEEIDRVASTQQLVHAVR
jgi:methyltransferase (TIGR00027 family)